MTRNTKALCFALIASAMALATAVCCIRCHLRDNGQWQVRDTVRVTIVCHDTVCITPVAPRDSIVVRYVRVKLPADTLVRRDTVCLTQADSTELTLPITQKRYEDSLYTAYVSGYMPSLDSITLYRTREYTTLTRTLRQPIRRWGIGIQAGYGLQLSTDPRLRPYIGIGVSYNIWNF